MDIRAVYNSEEEIPEQLRGIGLYSERNGKWIIANIIGMQTQANVDRLQTSLDNERNDHRETKDKLAVWAGLDFETTRKQLDRIPELETAAKQGGYDDAKIEQLADERVEAKIQQRLSPLEREIQTLKDESKEKDDKILNFETENRKRTIRDTVREVITNKQGIQATAEPDILMYAEQVFQVNDDGSITTREGMHQHVGSSPSDWLEDMIKVRPHWMGTTTGGGSTGSGGQSKVSENPWSKGHWNITEQGKIMREDRAKAERLAKMAGSKIGATAPSD